MRRPGSSTLFTRNCTINTDQSCALVRPDFFCASRVLANFLQGPNELSIVDVEFIPTMMGMRKGPCRTLSRFTYSLRANFVRILVWITHHPPGHLPSVNALRDVKLHHERRKLWNHGFTTAALNELKPSVQDRILEFVKELRKRTSPPGEKEVSLDLALWMSNFA